MDKSHLLQAALMGIALAAPIVPSSQDGLQATTLLAKCGSSCSSIAASCGGANSCGAPKPKNNGQHKNGGSCGAASSNKSSNGSAAQEGSQSGGALGSYSYPVPSRSQRVIAEVSDEDLRKINPHQDQDAVTTDSKKGSDSHDSGAGGCPQTKKKNGVSNGAAAKKQIADSGSWEDRVKQEKNSIEKRYEDKQKKPDSNGTKNGSKSLAEASQSSMNGAKAKNGASEEIMVIISEEELLPQLDAQGKALYNSLDLEGKALARKYASQSGASAYTNKNLAVKAAAQQIASKKANESLAK